jgi:DNA-binding SARP family transcriptional activator
METDPITLLSSPAEFYLFDQVRARANGRQVSLGSKKELCLVAALLLAKERLISRVDLLDWLWEDSTPESAPNDLDRYMVRLRKRLDVMGFKGVLINRNRQCQLKIPVKFVDVHRFRKLVDEARILEDHEAAERLRVALALSEGEPLAGLEGPRIAAERQQLVEERRNAELAFLRLEIKLGRHREHLAHLTRLHYDQPADAEIAGLTMYALHLVGRKPDAMAVYAQHHNRLNQEGFQVARQIRDLQTRILNDDGSDDLPLPEPDNRTGDEAADTPHSRAAPVRNRVINKISGSVTVENAEYVVFGIQNQVRP